MGVYEQGIRTGFLETMSNLSLKKWYIKGGGLCISNRGIRMELGKNSHERTWCMLKSKVSVWEWRKKDKDLGRGKIKPRESFKLYQILRGFEPGKCYGRIVFWLNDYGSHGGRVWKSHKAREAGHCYSTEKCGPELGVSGKEDVLVATGQAWQC